MTRRRRWQEVEWRRSPRDDESEDAIVWRRKEIPWDSEGFDLCECDGIEEGVFYDVRVRGASEDAVPSPWATVYRIRAETGDEPPPPAPTAPRLEGSCFLWDFPRREDLAGFDVRHVEADNPDPALWGLGVSLTPSLVAGPPLPLCSLPGGRRVLMVKAVLASGVESADAAAIAVEFGDRDASEPSAIATRDLGLAGAWPSTDRLLGVIDGAAIAGASLGSEDASPFWEEGTVDFWSEDDARDFWDVNEASPFWTHDAADARPFWAIADPEPFWAPRWADLLWEGALSLDEKDEGAANVLALLPTPGAGVMGWRAEFRTTDSAFWNRGDDGNPWWTDDAAPFWDEVVEPWRPWVGRLPGLRAGEIGLRLWAPGGRRRPRFEGLVAKTSGPIAEQHVSGVTLPVGGGRLSAVAGVFREIVEVLPIPRPGGAEGFPVLQVADLDAARGPLVVAAVSGGASVSATIDAIVRGRR